MCVCLFVCYKILDFYSDTSFNAVGLFLLSLSVCVCVWLIVVLNVVHMLIIPPKGCSDGVGDS